MVQRHRRPARYPRLRLALLAMALLVPSAVVAASAPLSESAPRATRASAPSSPAATARLAEHAVGALFTADGARGCTASVVHSPARNLVLTAAHCVNDQDVFFVPAYHDGQRPEGTWKVVDQVLDERWDDGDDPDFDLAFLVVRDTDGDRQVEDVAGALELGTGGPYEQPVRMTAYPADLDHPISCDGRSERWSATQLTITCPGFTEGTSGGPWVTAAGTVVGLIGGYERGGYSDDVSYSPYLGPDVAALYQRATTR
ncbi:hypothetical protein Lfu02_56700 [Longispora fulva]|uniref:V8-like Glu-specific endopeptidase n=1 Tax=Longispora fulva TaxID=619741 RepID=A0A8J7GIZ1_9ACTN|nr:serine protease [Longispora fulva]MBG6137348.1 hypothetical protein [Longispora fulva]GIG61298.1 hypothetical protein Lfu02_56700 [Longispora fulva]